MIIKMFKRHVSLVGLYPPVGGGGNSENIWAGVCRWNFEDTRY